MMCSTFGWVCAATERSVSSIVAALLKQTVMMEIFMIDQPVARRAMPRQTYRKRPSPSMSSSRRAW
jgi:hypothetical protein